MNLRADRLVKKYSKRTVVDGVSLEVNEGEVVGLLGDDFDRIGRHDDLHLSEPSIGVSMAHTASCANGTPGARSTRATAAGERATPVPRASRS